MICKICHSGANKYLESVVLKKYTIEYFKCSNCGFIQTEEPYWLKEAYSNAITSLDIGLLYRNNLMFHPVKSIIRAIFNSNKKFIDYGGGYGVFVRLMRDAGLDFYRQDIYCENIFSKHFDITDYPNLTEKFELLTAFEVFEHLEDPRTELEKMLCFSDNILFSTELQPNNHVNIENWWYFTPDTGQHISLYSSKSLDVLASEYKLKFYSNGKNLHLFSKKEISGRLFTALTNTRIAKIYAACFARKKSLLQSDFNYILTKI